MHRFYCPQLASSASRTPLLPDQPIPIGHDQAHHARRVLRLKLQDPVELFDGQGGVFGGVIHAWSQGGAVRVTGARHSARPQPWVEVAVALPKGARADQMTAQLDQLGVDRLVPLLTQRGVSHPSAAKLDRLRRITIESAKQCLRAYLMDIADPLPFTQAFSQKHDARLITVPPPPPARARSSTDPPHIPRDMARKDPGGDPGVERLDSPIRPARRAQVVQRLATAQRVLVVIGPEGGWTESEQKAAGDAGCLPWSLGPHVMRIETAAVMAAGIIRYLTEPTGGLSSTSGPGMIATMGN